MPKTKTRTKKKPTLAEVLDVLESLHGTPAMAERPEDPLTDHLLVAVLSLHTTAAKAREAVRRLSADWLDFNEVRVSPLFEIEAALDPQVPADRRRQAAADVRMALQDVWDGTHGLDLEPIRDRDPDDQRRFLKHLPNIPGGPAALIFQVALGEDRLALGPLEQHLLARLNLLPRSQTQERLRQAMEKRVKPGERVRFAWLTGAGANMFEKDEELDTSHPFVELLVRANAKELAVREQERKRREREEEQRRKAEERERQKQERAAAKKKKQEEAKKKRDEAARKKKAAAKKKADAARKKKTAAKKKADAARKKKAAAKARKAAAARAKKAAAKARKKTASKAKRKTASRAKTTTARKTGTRKTTVRKTAARKTAPRKTAPRKTATRKTAPRKTGARKTGKKRAKKTTPKKTVRRK